MRPRRDLNTQSLPPEGNALSIRPPGLAKPVEKTKIRVEKKKVVLSTLPPPILAAHGGGNTTTARWLSGGNGHHLSFSSSSRSSSSSQLRDANQWLGDDNDCSFPLSNTRPNPSLQSPSQTAKKFVRKTVVGIEHNNIPGKFYKSQTKFEWARFKPTYFLSTL